jgi:aarF domain-containing kinase
MAPCLSGNLLVDSRGRLVLIDFGLCAEIDRFDSNALTSAIVNLMRGDVEALVEDAVALRFLPADVDRAALLPPLRAVFERAQLAAVTEMRGRAKGGGRAQAKIASERAGADAPSAHGGSDKDSAGNDHRAVARRRRQFAAVSRDLNQIFFDFPFSVPEYFALITRALIVLEGIALTGDPNFDLFHAAYPYAAKHAAALFGKRQLAQMLGEAKSAAARNAEADAAAAAASARRPSPSPVMPLSSQ